MTPGANVTAAAVVDVLPGFHAQSHKPLEDFLVPFTVRFDAAPGMTFGEAQYPPGKIKEYPALGKLSVYDGRVIVRVPIQVASDAKPGDVALRGTLSFQICDNQTCFPPEDVPFEIKTSVLAAGSEVRPANEAWFAAPAASAPSPKTESGAPTSQPAVAASNASDDSGQTAELFGFKFRLSSLAGVLFAAFLAGIIFNVMPCVLPVLPLKAVGFYESSQHNRGRTIVFGLFFSLGVIAVFGVLAVFVLLSKQIFGRTFSWGQQFSYPAFVWAVAILLAALGIGMMGAFSLRLPTSVYGLNFRHDTLTGNFLWGGLTAILSTPCTAPLFPVVLGWAIGQPLAIGIIAVLMVGVGMAFPYLLLSAFPEVARKFPRTGPFSELVKQMMGFLLLASAAFFAGLQLLDDPNQWWLVLAVVVWGSLFLIVRTVQLSKNAMPLMAATAIAVLICGVMLTVAIRLTTPAGAAVRTSTGQDVVASNSLWTAYSEDELVSARKAGKTVLVKFTAKWCLNCKYIEATVFQDPVALDALRRQDVVLLKADLTRSDAAGWKLLEELTGGNGIPFTAVYHPGQEKPTGLSSIYDTQKLVAAIRPPGPQVTGVR